jgi:threonine synthase
VVVLATAHPAKFPETVQQALGERPETPPRLAAFWDRETAVTSLPADILALGAYL